MKKHVNIPVFIPHLGCPNMCVFCNQRSISGTVRYNREDVRKTIDEALATVSPEQEAQIAFFGGSFTGIDRDEMIYLLETGYSYVKSGRVSSIRLSTRPDYIDAEILDILSRYGVKTIELGLQSMSDRVLAACKRGHTAEQGREACRMIKERGFELIGQMMIGLPCSTEEDEIYTAREICALGADGARIYPTVIFLDTELADMAERGEYAPLSVEEAAARSASALDVFASAGVRVIRIGLQASEALVSGKGIYGASEYHEAIGELCYGELFRRRIDAAMQGGDYRGKRIKISVSPRSVSRAAGLRAANKDYFMRKYGLRGIKISPDAEKTEFDFGISPEEGE